MIECANLGKFYNGVVALEGVNLTIGRGKIIGLLGENGSGKTTLIKLINGLLSPSTGSVAIDGKAPGVESKKIISYLPENAFLDSDMRVREAVGYYADFFADFDREKAGRVLREMEIDPKKKIKNLSKGMKEKLSLTLVISRNAGCYILDEPIAGVDPAARDRILDTILNNFNENATVLVSTHLIADIERILDEVVFIHHGKIVLHEDADALRTRRGKSIDAIFREDFR
ncbi:MAG: ABC transporter ATP-binding protein [Oscillospiraceae bacterium]|jgi:ABC-2 type transport system ATP-binding protein|nr:ABC transporter ATP-binding protein [Oscillospiraceae bacterium]